MASVSSKPFGLLIWSIFFCSSINKLKHLHILYIFIQKLCCIVMYSLYICHFERAFLEFLKSYSDLLVEHRRICVFGSISLACKWQGVKPRGGLLGLCDRWSENGRDRASMDLSAFVFKCVTWGVGKCVEVKGYLSLAAEGSVLCTRQRSGGVFLQEVNFSASGSCI